MRARWHHAAVSVQAPFRVPPPPAQAAAARLPAHPPVPPRPGQPQGASRAASSSSSSSSLRRRSSLHRLAQAGTSALEASLPWRHGGPVVGASRGGIWCRRRRCEAWRSATRAAGCKVGGGGAMGRSARPFARFSCRRPPRPPLGSAGAAWNQLHSGIKPVASPYTELGQRGGCIQLRGHAPPPLALARAGRRILHRALRHCALLVFRRLLPLFRRLLPLAALFTSRLAYSAYVQADVTASRKRHKRRRSLPPAHAPPTPTSPDAMSPSTS